MSDSTPGPEGPRGSVRVGLGERSYRVQIGFDSLIDAGAEIARCTQATQAVIVTVPEVGRRYGARLARGLRAAGIRSHRIEVPDGDSTKNLRQVAKLYDAFLEKRLDRGAVVVALGGGVVGDLAGFAAASYLRGIAFVQVPTTLLAMVDASVGGKVGVNLKQGKNLVGAFYQPRLVWIDVSTLKTLPDVQRSAGMSEVIKAGAIWDADLFCALEQGVERALDLDPDVLLPLIERAIEIKAEVVSRDERESAGGVRSLLNFGHTLAHAIEALSSYRRIQHGEAVAVGMVHAARRSEELDLAPEGTRRRLEELLVRTDLPTVAPPFPRRAYLSALRVDKKREGGRVRYVVLREIGRADTVMLTPAEIFPARSARNVPEGEGARTAGASRGM